MFNNGVSHHTVKDDYSGVHKIFEWLSFVPKHKGASLPIMPAVDPIDRPIEFKPTKVQKRGIRVFKLQAHFLVL